MRISDWSSDVCSSDLRSPRLRNQADAFPKQSVSDVSIYALIMPPILGASNPSGDMNMIEKRSFDSLGHADHGWLNARHHFSFADYYDPNRTIGRASCRERVFHSV